MEKLETAPPVAAYPFLKWAGGKGQLLSEFEKFFPHSFGGYFEPFVGAGAVFFHLASKDIVQEATISDSNKNLMNCYVAIRDELTDILQQLKGLQKHVKDKDHFYRARRRFNEIRLSNGLEGNVEKGALLMYLNKTCYNGLYRVNRKGEFNVPWGRYSNPRIFDEENLRAVARTLQSPEVTVFCTDFEDSLRKAGERNFVYLDPPYQPLSRTSNFTGYTSENFGFNDQIRLSKVFRELDRRGCLAMLSNSPRVAQMYEGYHIRKVKASRAISCLGAGRGRIDELVVTNYEID